MEQDRTGYLGTHLLGEFYGCDEGMVNSQQMLEEAMLEAARIAGASIVSSHFHAFSPVGLSGIVVIKESHFAVHTWPEHKYAAIDLFTCSPQMDFQAACDYLAETLQATHHSQRIVKRGSLEEAYQTNPIKHT